MKQPQQNATNPLRELTEANMRFLDSLHVYGNNICDLARRLVRGIAKLHHEVVTGSISPAGARQLALVAIAAFLIVVSSTVRRRRALQFGRRLPEVYIRTVPVRGHALRSALPSAAL